MVSQLIPLYDPLTRKRCVPHHIELLNHGAVFHRHRLWCRIVIPARGRACKHVSPFDLSTHLEWNIQEGTVSWIISLCPPPLDDVSPSITPNFRLHLPAASPVLSLPAAGAPRLRHRGWYACWLGTRSLPSCLTNMDTRRFPSIRAGHHKHVCSCWW